ncbi:MAG: hypothetical protein HGA85_05005 [Nanoarchaeota archaeon]|nr:hypothetical protein [Nanoarchaeota archaeon]
MYKVRLINDVTPVLSPNVSRKFLAVSACQDIYEEKIIRIIETSQYDKVILLPDEAPYNQIWSGDHLQLDAFDRGRSTELLEEPRSLFSICNEDGTKIPNTKILSLKGGVGVLKQDPSGSRYIINKQVLHAGPDAANSNYVFGGLASSEAKSEFGNCGRSVPLVNYVQGKKLAVPEERRPVFGGLDEILQLQRWLDINITTADLAAIDKKGLDLIKEWYTQIGAQIIGERIIRAAEDDIRYASQGIIVGCLGVTTKNMCIDMKYRDAGNVCTYLVSKSEGNQSVANSTYFPQALDTFRIMLETLGLKPSNELKKILGEPVSNMVMKHRETLQQDWSEILKSKLPDKLQKKEVNESVSATITDLQPSIRELAARAERTDRLFSIEEA